MFYPPHPYPTGVGGGVRVQNWREGGTGGREGRMGGREGGRDAMAIMNLVHMAWNGCIIGNPSEAV